MIETIVVDYRSSEDTRDYGSTTLEVSSTFHCGQPTAVIKDVVTGAEYRLRADLLLRAAQAIYVTVGPLQIVRER